VRGEKTMILLEGNIGAGKSTVGQTLRESGLIAFIEEPVGTWQEVEYRPDLEGKLLVLHGETA